MDSLLKHSDYYDRIDWTRVDIEQLIRQVKTEMPDTYKEDEFWERVAFRAGSLVNENMEYDKLASMIMICLHEKVTSASFVETMKILQQNNDVMGRSRPILSEDFMSFILANHEMIESIYHNEAGDCFLPTLFGWRTLIRSYLLRSNGIIRERLPHMFMRIALFIHKDDWCKMIQCFRDLLAGRYTHATPTLFHAGTRRSQMASCFLPESEIWTTRGIKRIDQMMIGDEIMTHEGRIRRVLQVHKNPLNDRTLYELYLADGRYVATATGDHEFLVWDGTKIQWKCLEKLTTNDFMAESFTRTVPRAEFGDQDDTFFLQEFPLIAGMIIASSYNIENQSTSNYEIPHVNHRLYMNTVAKIKDKGYECWIHANTLHFGPSEMEKIRSINREDVLVEQLHSPDALFAQGWLDVWRESPVVFPDRKEAEMMSMLLFLVFQERYEVAQDDGNFRLFLATTPSSSINCCMKRRVREVVEGRPFIRFGHRKKMQKGETCVWTLGIDEDHSYTVNGVIAKNCFLMGTEDSVEGIFQTISDAAQISKWAGGIGIHISNIRANKSYIYGTNGNSNGILPMLKVYNNVSRYIDQCFAPDVLVFRKDGLCPIGSIRQGDYVMNSDGEYQEVERVLEYDWDGMIMSIDGARVTNEHNFLNQDQEYRMLSEMSIGDEVLFPLIRFPYDQKVDTEMTQDHVYFLAHILSDWKEQAVTYAGRTIWTVSSIELQTVQRVVCEMCHSFESDIDSETMIVSISTSHLESWIERQKERIMRITVEKQRFFLGILNLHNKFSDNWKNEIMALRLMTGDGMIQKGSFHHRPIYSFQIREEEYKGKIYDLEMKGEKNYVTQLGIVHNGGGKRNGAFAMYIEPWHADIYDFIMAKRNVGAEDERARDLFYGLWIPDLFMERVEKNEDWSLFCPSTAPHLSEYIGPQFKTLYEQYEDEKRYVRRVRARDLWTEILRSQIETGTPYMLYKDACNYKSNQQNLGIIKSSNLCVTGDMRVMTSKGIFPIAGLCDESVNIWNGDSYRPVTIRQTGKNKDLIRVRLSNGTSLTCTPEHHFYVVRQGKVIRLSTIELKNHDLIAPYRLPDLPEIFPHTIQLSIQWIMQKGISFEDSIFIYSNDHESLQELMFHMEWCGIRGMITGGNPNFTYKLIISRPRFNRLCKSVSLHTQDADKPEWVLDLKIVDFEKIDYKGDTYCFTEPVSGKGWFNGVCTGQCTEIIEYSDNEEYACCNLASIALPRFIIPNPQKTTSSEWIVYTKKLCPFCRLLELECPNLEKRDIEDYPEEWAMMRNKHDIKTLPAVMDGDRYLGGFTDVWKTFLCPVFDFNEFYRVVYAVTENLNHVIDLNIYPIPQTEISNKRHRPIGIGIQGLADVFGALRLVFDGPEARMLNKEIFETMYFAALSASNQLAIQYGPYSTFKNSPLASGKFHFELSCPVMKNFKKPILSDRHDWETLRSSIIRYGVRNSLMIAPMPTASTSQILGNTECFEPWTSNIYSRRTSAGEFYICNPFLQRDLQAIGIWSSKTLNQLIANQGSVASFPIPSYLKDIYRTVWEIPQRSLIDMAIDRQYFIDQSQSLNIFITEPSLDLLTKIHFYGWKNGLKTGCYYIRSRAPVSSINFTLSPDEEEQTSCTACSA
jgi:ribonucleotide reductase alpha subunit